MATAQKVIITPHTCTSKKKNGRRMWVRNPPGHECLSVVSVVLTGIGICDELITRPQEWYVVVCDLEPSRMRSWPAAPKKYCHVIRSQRTAGVFKTRVPGHHCDEILHGSA